MGTYLSTPVKDKCEEAGEDLQCPTVPCRWGVVDMQGWRKGMEDAHVAKTNVQVADAQPAKSSVKVFGVFDGHGGPEVARFCQLYMVDVLRKEVVAVDGTENEHAAQLTASNCGEVLIASFHALDRMIDQDARLHELHSLRTTKPEPGQAKEVGSIAIPPATGEPIKVREANGLSNSTLSTSANQDEPHVTSMEEVIGGETSTIAVDQRDTAEDTSEESDCPEEEEEEEEEEETTRSNEAETESNHESEPEKIENAEPATDGDDDADSDEAVGLDDATKLDQDLMTDEAGPVAVETPMMDEVASMTLSDPVSPRGRRVSGMFKFLSLKGKKGQVAAKVEESPRSSGSPAKVATAGQPTENFRASIIQNGRQICNLRDHPIHAGCAAVVVVLLDRTLTVANAGDCRAVLCRVGGKTEPLSFDHKPQQDRELSRIRQAGGFVNQFGRVNGNLNLSRSIGDLKYKQVPGIPPGEQMITAEPDIVQTTLHPEDEFIILGCDGIWDCLTNEQAVHYVRTRIDKKRPTEIGAEMLDEIISEDPRATQGIGGDNMTIMIIDLQPQSRSYAVAS